MDLSRVFSCNIGKLLLNPHKVWIAILGFDFAEFENIGSVISTVVPIEQESTRALQLEEEKWDKENNINELKVPGTAEVRNYLSLLLTQGLVQTCHLQCPQLTPTRTLPEGMQSNREAELKLVKEQYALEKQQEAKGKQCKPNGVFHPQKSNLRCLLPSLMVQTECMRTMKSIVCRIARKVSGLPN